jgi:hypothetical protein
MAGAAVTMYMLAMAWPLSKGRQMASLPGFLAALALRMAVWKSGNAPTAPTTAATAPYHAVPLAYPYTYAGSDNGEIDYAERNVGSQTVYLFIHNAGGNAGSCSAHVDTTKWHNYAIDWRPGSITWYIDGQQTCKKYISNNIADEINAGQMDMFPGTGTPMQHDYEQVDWVHYYPL